MDSFVVSFRAFAIVAALISVSHLASSQQILTTIPGIPNPFAEAVDSTRNKIYIANEFTSLASVIDGSSFSVTTVPVGSNPRYIDINPVTNKIYVGALGDATVTIIDGTTLATQTVHPQGAVDGIAVNSVTNKIYVSNGAQSTVTVIDGATLGLTTVPVTSPLAIAVNSVTNKIYAVYNGNGGQGIVTEIDGNTLATTQIPVGYFTFDIAIDNVHNKIYVDNLCNDGNCEGNGTVTVIDGATHATASVSVGILPQGIAVNPVTNKIYVANYLLGAGNTVSVIDGVTLAEQTVTVAEGPLNIAVNSTTNKIYVTSNSVSGVTVIDGATNNTTIVSVGGGPKPVVVDPIKNRAYVGNFDDNTISVIAWLTLQFVPVAPCRVVDTRSDGGPISGYSSRDFSIIQSSCGIPPTANAFSLNVTAVPQGPLGYLTIWPTAERQPTVSTMNSPDGRTKANAAIVPAGYQGSVSVFVTDTTNVILDINGYFTSAGEQTRQFYPLPPCRVIDTRGDAGDLGGPYLQGGAQRDFPVTESLCISPGVSAQAYSFNVTAVPHASGQRLGYLTVWPEGQPQPVVSTLNNPTGTTVANAAIVPAGTGGGITVYPSQDTDLVVDINGYFASPGQGGLSYYPSYPCRVIDTRENNGRPFQGELTVNVVGSACAPPPNTQAFIFNATVVPPGPLGYLTLWADGSGQPLVSTLNAADGSIASNMAIVPTANGSIDAYASALTQLILDLSGYFAP
jgi:DNA-binding beta-propeller fold protein YncE